MKILCVHAHFDDFEFVAAGTFELWRRQLGKDLKAKVVVCTDGAAGHHFRTRKETAQVRLLEQRASARIGGYEFELLRLPAGGDEQNAVLAANLAQHSEKSVRWLDESTLAEHGFDDNGGDCVRRGEHMPRRASP